MDLVALRFMGNVGELNVLTLVGNYNEVLVTVSRPRPPTSPTSGRRSCATSAWSWRAPRCTTLPTDDYVIRMTRSDPLSRPATHRRTRGWSTDR